MTLTKVSGGILQQPIDVGIITATSIQVGSGTTIHDTGIDLGSGNITSHNINSTGIVTSTGLDVNGNGDISGDLSVSGNVSIGGTLTYEDVTNIDSVGIITARDGIHVTGGSVGINTTVPAEKLDVVGTIRASAGTNQYMHMYPAAGAGYFDVRNSTSYPSIVFRQIGSGGTQERLRITSTGKIGIGTDPTAQYFNNLVIGNNVSGDKGITIRTNSDSSGVLAFSDTDAGDANRYDGYIRYSHIDQHMGFYTNGANERVRITSGGLVGIGTETPTGKLEVAHSSQTNLLTLKRTSGNSGIFNISLGGAEPGTIFSTSGTCDDFVFITSNEALRITSDGKIGLGMTNPVAKLHIGTEDDTALTAQTLFVEGAKTGFANYTGLPQNQLCLYDNTTSTAGSGGAISFGANCGGSQQTWIAAIESQRDSSTNDASNYAGSIVFWTRPAQSTPTEKLRITSAGDVGIGTAVPVTSSGYANLSIAKSSGGQIEFKKLSSGRTHYIWGDDNLNIGASYNGGGSGAFIVNVNGNNERFRVNGDGRVGIGTGVPLGALHIHANQGTDTALWIGDSSTNRYLAINEQGSSKNFNHINTRYNDNGIHAHYILDNPYANAAGYGSQILFRGYDNGTTAYIETSNEAASTARGTLRLRGADNHGLDVRSTGEINTTHASNIGYETNAATNTRSLVYTSLDPQKRSTSSADWFILKTFYPNKSGRVNIHADMYITSGTYYFSFRVREEGTDTIVFNAGDNGGFGAYENPSGQSGNVHSYKTYKWICPLIKAHKRYYIEMAATNSAGTSVNANASQQVFLKNLYIYSMSGGHSDGSGSMLIQQGIDEATSTNYGGTTRAAMSGNVNRDSLNTLQYFAGTESTFLGWFTSRAYNRYLDFELNINGSYMWFAQAYGYLYSRGQVAGSMISGYTYTNNQILNKYSLTLGNRGWYGSYRTSAGNLCLKFDSGSNGYSEGRIALFIGTHGPANPDWRVLRYRQNDTTNNIF